MRLIIILAVLALASPAQAFKVDTHMWLAQDIWEDINDDGKVWLGHDAGSPFYEAVVPAYIRDSVIQYKDQFIVGVMGADLYPDLIAGQMTTHPGLALQFDETSLHADVANLLDVVGIAFLNRSVPGWQTDDWLKHVRDSALSIRSRNRGRPTPELAFAYGYMLHAAMDTWAHTYVNTYSGDIFSIGSNQKAAARHVVLEALINHIHAPFYGEVDSQQISRTAAQREAARAARDPSRLAANKTDHLTALAAPTEFVRNTLILNPTAAAQYAREKGAAHVWAMWVWWELSRQISRDIRAAEQHLNSAYTISVGRVTSYEPVWQQAQAARDAAVETFELIDGNRRNLESAAIDATRAVNDSRAALLGAIADFPPVQAALNAAGGAINQVLGMMTVEPLLSLKNTYLAAVNELNRINTDLTPVIAQWEADRIQRDGAIDELTQAARELDLRRATRDALFHARDIGWQSIHALSNGWTSNIERGVDEYILAWEESVRELVRPHGSRYRDPTNPIWPLQRWLVCWGPAFGMPGPLTPTASQGCAMSLSAFSNATTNLDLLVKNSLLPEAVRETLDELHRNMKERMAGALPLVGQMVANAIGEPMIGGTAAFAARMWDTDVDLQDASREYSRDESRRNLPLFTGNQLRAALLADNLPVDRTNVPLNEMMDFAPFHNALMLSKLTLLDGQTINRMMQDKGITQTVFSGGSQRGAPLYKNSRLGGEVLAGAIRSIDGNHQWLPVAPDLPRRQYRQDLRITEENCRRFGYPRERTYPIVDDQFVVEKNPTIYVNCANFESYPTYLGGVRIDNRERDKGGFRLWQDPTARRMVFNRIFKGPLSPGICNKLIQENNRPLAATHGCFGGAGNHYPPTHSEHGMRQPVRPTNQRTLPPSSRRPVTTNNQPRTEGNKTPVRKQGANLPPPRRTPDNIAPSGSSSTSPATPPTARKPARTLPANSRQSTNAAPPRSATKNSATTNRNPPPAQDTATEPDSETKTVVQPKARTTVRTRPGTR